MRIVASELAWFRVPGPAARGAALLSLHDEDGREGVGEAAPIPGWSAETIESAGHALQSVRDHIGSVDDAAPPAEAVRWALAPHRALLDACPTAVFALESALLDLLARRRGEDVASCLSGEGSAPASGARAPRDAVGKGDGRGGGGIEASALLLGPSSGAAFVDRGLAALARGFRTIKVKLRAEDDATLALEIEGLAALRRAAPAFELRLDPNGRWSIEDARRRLALLAPLAPSFVEQPVPARHLAALGPCAVPWAADESLALPGFAETLSREAGCCAFVLKPAALGLRRTRELASLARAHGIPITVTHFLDGPVGLAAACETALSLSRGAGLELLACGLDPHAGLQALPRELLPHHREPTRVHATGAAGLGLPEGHRLRDAVLAALSGGSDVATPAASTSAPGQASDVMSSSGAVSKGVRRS